MIIEGYHRLTLCWIFIYSIWLLLCISPNVKADQIQCDSNCSLMIKDQDRKYLEFKRLAISDSVKVIFFQLYIDGQDFNRNGSTVFYAWIKNSFGKAIFLLPSPYIITSLSLYTIFISTMNITLIDQAQDCYNDECKKENIFKTLIDFTHLRLNHTCNEKYCTTICRRNFVDYDANFGMKINASCCQQDLLNPAINISQCFKSTSVKQMLPFIPWSQLIIILLSVFLSAFTINKVINWYLASAQR